jgi:hypothetical protein
MCDTNNILGSVFTKLDLPGAQTATKAGAFMERNASSIGAGAGGILDAYSAISNSRAAQKSAGKRMAQIDFATNMQLKQTEQMQDRRLGANRAAFAKSGIKETGTARRMLDEQIKQDEMQILGIKLGRDNAMNETMQAAKQAKKDAMVKVAGSFAKAAGTIASGGMTGGLG